MTRKANLEKVLAFERHSIAFEVTSEEIPGVQAMAVSQKLAPLHAALLDAVVALEELQLGHSHKSGDEHIRLLGDNYGWCSFCQTKVGFGPGIAEEALSKIDKALGEI